ncbi:MAG TPA: glycosyltransferase [candidate division WOR-3 bacterium]|uniref:Glycosyltransferase n=1 Tax=candidate division WOR-3 bacterium TaxID=2052148 RepID=A0A9C9EKT0_UNCW3|nr:glycosyltransferase [candidate division WOR-3 bacterium]
MAHRIDDYAKIVDGEVMYEIFKFARQLCGRKIVHINSTYYGGGVAEMLSALVPLMNDTGAETGWRHLRGSPDFFNITKKFHNALQGDTIHLTEMKKKLYLEANQDFSTYNHIDHDCVIVHDPQPLPLIKFYKKRQPWIWRVHVDLSHPNLKLWNFLKNYVLRYDMVIISHKKYRRKDLPVEQRVIHPAIDPLSSKNIEISEKVIEKTLKKFKVPTDKPILCQISRFDKWKDPEGVVDVFRLVKEKVDCRLVLCGSAATDDPESSQTYERVRKKASNHTKNNDIILITSLNNILVNALQRKSAVIIQKSLREGFGLTVTEGLWKEKPVVAAKVGGIPLQIKNGENGFLVPPRNTKQFAAAVLEILKSPKLAKKLGKKGRVVVKNNFLITRLLLDYLKLVNEILKRY